MHSVALWWREWRVRRKRWTQVELDAIHERARRRAEWARRNFT